MAYHWADAAGLTYTEREARPDEAAGRLVADLTPLVELEALARAALALSGSHDRAAAIAITRRKRSSSCLGDDDDAAGRRARARRPRPGLASSRSSR